MSEYQEMVTTIAATSTLYALVAGLLFSFGWWVMQELLEFLAVVVARLIGRTRRARAARFASEVESHRAYFGGRRAAL